MILALMNLKPGTAKTTSSVWLAHALAEACDVLLGDLDPAASALEWADLAADEGGFNPRIRVVGLPSTEVHHRVPQIARDGEDVVLDCPQIEDHAKIARSAGRVADEIVITCAPTPIEMNRTSQVADFIEEVNTLRAEPVRVSILLNRCVTGANSVQDAADTFAEQGYHVLAARIPRKETYAQSFGGPISTNGNLEIWRYAADELRERDGRPTPMHYNVKETA